MNKNIFYIINKQNNLIEINYNQNKIYKEKIK